MDQATCVLFDLPQSDACFIKAYPAETTEAFLDGHVSAFAFFGGVPISILYDNLKIAVARILGDGKRCRFDGRIAQLVEQLTLNRRVHGSSPCAPTIEIKDLLS
jgi:transposase